VNTLSNRCGQLEENIVGVKLIFRRTETQISRFYFPIKDKTRFVPEDIFRGRSQIEGKRRIATRIFRGYFDFPSLSFPREYFSLV
jgi:hypothetical protein